MACTEMSSRCDEKPLGLLAQLMVIKKRNLHFSLHVSNTMDVHTVLSWLPLWEHRLPQVVQCIESVDETMWEWCRYLNVWRLYATSLTITDVCIQRQSDRKDWVSLICMRLSCEVQSEMSTTTFVAPSACTLQRCRWLTVSANHEIRLSMSTVMCNAMEW